MDQETRLITPRTWEEIAHEYRRRWQEGHPEEPERWAEHEPWYRYGYDMAYDPRYQERRWADVEADLRMQYPEWAERHGYARDHHASLWERFKDSVKEAWESATRRDQEGNHRGVQGPDEAALTPEHPGNVPAGTPANPVAWGDAYDPDRNGGDRPKGS